MAETLLEEALATICHDDATDRVQLNTDLPHESLGWVPAALYQVFCNLLKNAVEAMPEGGVLDVKAWSQNGRVVVEIRDTGTGLRPEHIERVFDPFFTTKPPGKGTGLGLAICHDLVQKAGGELTAANHPEGGAVFRVDVPPLPDSQPSGPPHGS